MRLTLKSVRMDLSGCNIEFEDGSEYFWPLSEPLFVEAKVPRKEITESGIAHIEVAVSDSFNVKHNLNDGTAKWFRDELDQLWVKFDTPNRIRVEHHVIPAHLVRDVVYLPRSG